MFIDDLENVLADFLQLLLDLLPVGLRHDHLVFCFPLLLALDRADDPLVGSPRSYDVLVRHGENVPLLHSHLGIYGGLHGLHRRHQLVAPLRLLGQLGLVTTVFIVQTLTIVGL